MKNQNMPRVPTEQEMEELANDVADRATDYLADAEELQEARNKVAKASIAVFDHYVSVSGFDGKVMIVVWDDAPTYHELYFWSQEGLGRIQQSSHWFELFAPEE
jgi:hypothetical protein